MNLQMVELELLTVDFAEVKLAAKLLMSEVVSRVAIGLVKAAVECQHFHLHNRARTFVSTTGEVEGNSCQAGDGETHLEGDRGRIDLRIRARW